MAPRFDLDFDEPTATVQHVAPGLRRVIAANPSHFTFRGTGTYIVGSGKSVAVIDPGPNIDAHLEALLAAVEADEVTHVLVTHTHRDHSPLATPLARRTGALTYGFGPNGHVPDHDPTDTIDFGVEDDEEDEDEASAGETEKGKKNEDNHDDGGFDTDFVPDVALRHGDQLAGEGWTMTAVYTPGHTSNHLCFGWTENGYLFSGDHVMGWSSTVISAPDGSMSQYMASLDLLLERPDTVYWPTHGRQIENPQGHVRDLIEHRRSREQQILQQLTEGVHTIEQIVPTLYAVVTKKLWPAAARSVHAHLVGLVDQGVVISASGTNRLTDEYTLT
ncbi:MAG: MBL fold metallo-hydrolase [Actinomycetia bacterium]|nr:MBL fold metallo-hydrolase [Actinomycetes bacterium]